MHFDKDLDASGLACPMPIVKTKKALAAMASGEVLRVFSTDQGSVSDMPVFAEHMGHALLHAGEQDGKYVFFVKKG
jgi:tRNA 2-thiouridine synthesizing protein A